MQERQDRKNPQITRCLRIAEVHDFIKQLIDEDEVVANRFLFKLLEVLTEDGDQFVQEREYEGGVGVRLCHRQQDEVIVFDENERHFTVDWAKKKEADDKG